MTANSQLNRAVRLLFYCLLLAECLAVTGIGPFPHQILMKNFLFGKMDMFLVSALLGSFLLYVWSRPPRKELFVALGAGIVLECVYFFKVPPGGRWGHLLFLGAGLGAAGLGVQSIQLWRARPEEKTKRRTQLFSSLVLPLFVLVSFFFLELTTRLHPTTLDFLLYAFDESYGTQISFVCGTWFAKVPALSILSQIFYFHLPLGLAFVYGVQTYYLKKRPPVDLLIAFLATAGIGYILYHVFPAVGPLVRFGAYFPNQILPANSLPIEAVVAPPTVRNALPSLHTAWVLLLWWNTRQQPVWARIIAGLFGVFTIFAALGKGEHYLVDSVAGVPYAVMIQALCTTSLTWDTLERRYAFWGGAGLMAGWLFLLRFVVPQLNFTPVFSWGLSLLTVGGMVYAEERLARVAAYTLMETEEVDEPVRDVADSEDGTRLTKLQLITAAVFFISGFAGLIYEVLFSKSLALVFGSTAIASHTVLATYMGGMAAGAWIGGKLAARLRKPLLGYAVSEIGIGIWCALTPWVFQFIQWTYVKAAAGASPDAKWLIGLQIGLGGCALVLPTILMGMTLPLMTAFLEQGKVHLGRTISLLYASNTLGAALGALLTGYLIIPALGLRQTTMLAVAANLLVGLLGIQLQKKEAEAGGQRWAEGDQAAEKGHHAEETGKEEVTPEVGGVPGVDRRQWTRVGFGILMLGGVVTLALEVNYIHLLAVVAGNSAYAFALMLFAFLLGLGGGSELARRVVLTKQAKPADIPVWICWGELGLAATILAGVFLWTKLPLYFADFAGYETTRAFGEREFVRGVVCLLAMLPPAVCIGFVYPLAFECLNTGKSDQNVQALGRGAALNTVGNIAGVFVGGFLLLSYFGPLKSLQCLAVVAVGIAGLAAWLVSERQQRTQALFPLIGVLILFVIQPGGFDYNILANGANVYFSTHGYGEVIDHTEDLDGGLTTIAVRKDPATEKQIVTMLTNGKFQGDNGPEVKAQFGVALCPLLHTDRRGRALVIGYGTGASARVIYDAQFNQIDVAELSSGILRMANQYFSEINGNLQQQPNVNFYVTDGRNFLLLEDRKYDVIAMEVNSIWFAGAASLYNQEFYQLAKRRLQPDGVLQQWVQLHRLSPEDLLMILGTVRSEFKYVWVYFANSQGVIVASNEEQFPRMETLAKLENEPKLKPVLKEYGESIQSILELRLLTPEGVNTFLESVQIPPGRLISTDTNLFLEYSTPRANVRAYEPSLKENLALLGTFRPQSVLDGTKLTSDDINKPR